MAWLGSEFGHQPPALGLIEEGAAGPPIFDELGLFDVSNYHVVVIEL